ncbi:hypothetical protein ID866_6959 [Astraeus odoratus]|nr:hypothetical protein ID866_6959 [Astraeus odoratus]
MAQRTESAAKYLGPLIAKRQEHMYSNDENDKPVDFLQWAMDEGNETSVEKLTRRIIALNLALLHTSTTTFVQALYHLAENPAYSRLLREEVTAVVRTDGWTKDAISKMVRIDSFLKETQRLDGFSVVPIKRKTMKNITLSDGTFIPKGTYVAVPSHAIHNDSELYENPDTFDPFRFVELRSKDEDNTRYQMVSVNPESLGFGLGTPAW